MSIDNKEFYMLSIARQAEIQNSRDKMSKRLQELIIEHKMTRIMIMDVCGVSYNTIYKLFRGGRLSIQSLLKISEGIQKLEKKDCFF